MRDKRSLPLKPAQLGGILCADVFEIAHVVVKVIKGIVCTHIPHKDDQGQDGDASKHAEREQATFKPLLR